MGSATAASTPAPTPLKNPPMPSCAATQRDASLPRSRKKPSGRTLWIRGSRILCADRPALRRAWGGRREKLLLRRLPWSHSSNPMTAQRLRAANRTHTASPKESAPLHTADRGLFSSRPLLPRSAASPTCVSRPPRGKESSQNGLFVLRAVPGSLPRRARPHWDQRPVCEMSHTLSSACLREEGAPGS